VEEDADRDQRGQDRPTQVGHEHHPLAVATVRERSGDRGKEEVRGGIDCGDDPHDDSGAGQREDEQRHGGRADRVATDRHGLADEQRQEVAIFAEGLVRRSFERHPC
jgi:hypothetical protein